jgi:hypothetical protein
MERHGQGPPLANMVGVVNQGHDDERNIRPNEPTGWFHRVNAEDLATSRAYSSFNLYGRSVGHAGGWIS